jgi:hypothetical protein
MPVEPAFTYSSHTWLHVLSRSTSRTSSRECPFMPIAANLKPVREAVSLPMKRSIATGLPRMEEAETIEDDELVALARKVPSEKRHIAFDLLKTLLDGAATETIRRVKGTPHQHWIEAHKRGETLPDFIKRAFTTELANGTMHKGLFSRYKNLRRDFYSYKRSNELPDWLKAIPTQDEWNTRRLADLPQPPRPGRITVRTEEGRLHDAAKYRAAKRESSVTGSPWRPR